MDTYITDPANGQIGYAFNDVFKSKNSMIFTAVITNVLNHSNVLTVFADKGIGRLDAIYVPSICTQFFGVSANYLPPVGEHVLCLRDPANMNLCYVIGVIPSGKNPGFVATTGFENPINKEAFQGVKGQARTETEKNTPTHSIGTKPSDLSEGEVTFTHPSGVGIEILSNLARLKASDLAFVEALLIDDMIRIMSLQFEHLHAAGETKIINNQGFADKVTNITNSEANILNNPNQSSSGIFSFDGKNSIDTSKDEKNANFYHDSLWLLNDFKGKLGNVINGWITSPSPLLWTDDKSKPLSPNGRYHWNQDGSFILQSRGDIILEKVTSMPVAKLDKTRIDEIYDAASRQLDNYKEWIPAEGPSAENCARNLYKIRDYARYLTNYLTLAEFRAQQASGRIKVFEESEVGKSLSSAVDGYKVNADSGYVKLWDNFLVYTASRFILTRSGDIVAQDTYGNSLSMGADGLRLSSTTNLEINSAGSVNIHAGQNINILARKNIEITAVLRGIVLKANRWFEMFCNVGPMLLQSGFKLLSNMEPEQYDKYAGKGASQDKDFMKKIGAAKTAAITVKSTEDAAIHVLAGTNPSEKKYSNILLSAGSSILTAANMFVNKIKTLFAVSDWFNLSKARCLVASAQTEFARIVSAQLFNQRSKPMPPPMANPNDDKSLVMASPNESFDEIGLIEETSKFIDKQISDKTISGASFGYPTDIDSGLREWYENLSTQTVRLWSKEEDALPKPPIYKNQKWEEFNYWSSDYANFFGNATIGYPWPRGSVTDLKYYTYDPAATSKDLMSVKFKPNKSMPFYSYEGVVKDKEQK
jgi:hypothetical protein